MKNERSNISRPLTVAIAGGIGVGKTTLGRILTEGNPKFRFFEDNVKRNPYIASFYSDMKAWSFHSRISFLALKTEIYSKFDGSFSIGVIDRCIHELDIFARIQRELGNMTKDEYSIYEILHSSILSLVPQPDLYIYVTCSTETAIGRIRLRGREFEKGITQAYLSSINHHYDEWVAQLPAERVLRINTDIATDIKKTASGLSSEIFRRLIIT